MSHFVKIRTRITERQHLVAALQAMHLQYQASEREDLVVRGYRDNTERAEIVINTGTNYDIGLRRREGSYEAVADWWGVQHGKMKQETFLQQLHRENAHQTVLQYARERPELILEWEDRGEERIYELKERISV
jgi:hypothetical protein